MKDICNVYTVSRNGNNIGRAKIEREGIRYRVSAEVGGSIDAAAPFRLAAVCGENIVTFGVMMPESGGYKYSRIFTADALKNMGLIDISAFTISSEGETVQPPVSSAEEGWWHTDKAGELLEEGEFRRIFSACREALYRQEGELCYLAVPIIKGEEFPVMPVFCLGEPWKIGGRLCLVFKIINGKLIF